MRILKLQLKNLNSLKGTWCVDFTAPEYGANDIFAITGPTGAGKTTLLDGICLALFGATPRLGRVTRANNEIMSRSTGECYAEVEFETTAGRYRCHWSQHRARRSPNGELQQHRQEITDARNGAVLETKIREVGLLVERITGLDFEQFRRSMLLAQGDFAAFLNADAGQRAPILEQLTGTEIYSRISIQVHERTAAERRKTELMQAEIGAITLLDEEEATTLQQGLEQSLKRAAGQRQRLDTVNSALQRYRSLQAVEAQLQTARTELAAWQERCRQAQDKLERYQWACKARELSPEVKRLQQLQEQLGQVRNQLLEGQKQHQQQGQALTALTTLLEEKKNSLEKTRQALEEDAVLSKEIRALDTRIKEHRLQIQDGQGALKPLEASLKEGQEQLPRLQQTVSRQGRELEETSRYLKEHQADAILVEHFAHIKGQLDELTQLQQQQLCEKQKAAQLDLSLQQAKTTLQHTEEQVQRTEEARLRLFTAREQLGLERSQLLAGRESGRLHEQAESQAATVTRLEQLCTLFSRQEQLRRLQGERARELAAFTSRLEQYRQQFTELSARESTQQQLITQLSENQRLRERIINLSAERQRLQADQPCPLCGATDHPWASELPVVDDAEQRLEQAHREQEQLRQRLTGLREQLASTGKDIEYKEQLLKQTDQEQSEIAGQLSQSYRQLAISPGTADSLERINSLQARAEEGLEQSRAILRKLAEQEEQLRSLNRSLEEAGSQQSKAQQARQEARHRFQSMSQEQEQHHKALAQLGKQYGEKLDRLRRQLVSLGIAPSGADQAEQLIAELSQRTLQWKQALAREQQLQAKLNRVQGELERLKAGLGVQQEECTKKRQGLARVREKLAQLSGERRERYGDRSPDQEEQRHRRALEQAEQAHNRTLNQRIELEKTIHGLGEQAETMTATLTRLESAAQEQEQGLETLLSQQGFSDLGAYDRAKLAAEELRQLAELKEGLDKEQIELHSRISEHQLRQGQLQQELEQEQPQPQLEEALQELSERQQQLQQQIGADRERLENHHRAKTRLAQQYQALLRQQQEEERWQALHQLIGSADGKKFRIFAQGITFELMIRHANHHLAAMNDRYTLLRDPAQPLELQVMDNYQAGEIRSTRNLSGGESFIVSLALSLGLSSMASRKVQIDSLFLDEGFGTLDEEALDTALQTLAALRHEGKLIGIISHVPMLRERIGLQIRVAPQAGGTSLLQGPGCSRID
ncbi:AAA family ATPase [Desulfogranum mediterraneum]|uniref:AAA family ATPase n=1 Tax=Desulfogranum mediterraneum TaxID=160661 RepID=UPI0003F68A35|nr:AAA family ATPase [Desulfogranum mediterraneum]